MDENRARRVVDALRQRGIDARTAKEGVYQFGIRVALPGGREAVWDSDGTAGLEAQVMRDGMLVGFVPSIEGSEDFDEAAVIDAIARTDYDKPIAQTARHRAAAGRAVASRRRGLPALPRRLSLPLDHRRAARAASRQVRWAHIAGRPGRRPGVAARPVARPETWCAHRA